MKTSVAIKERPIFLPPSKIEAALGNRMTQIRKVVKPLCGAIPFIHINESDPYPYYFRRRDAIWDSFKTLEELVAKYCPYGKTGDRLWVRETLYSYSIGNTKLPSNPTSDIANYGWGYATDRLHSDGDIYGVCPPARMPKWASRITFEVLKVRLERLQDISEKDAIAEGVKPMHLDDLGQTWQTYRRGFQSFWDVVNAKTYSWESNPWVWAVEVKQLQSAIASEVQR